MTWRNKTLDGMAAHVSKFILAVAMAAPAAVVAQSNLTIYTDSLINGWQDYSYNTTRNFANTSPVHSGSDSISATITSAYGGIQLYHAPMTDSNYASVSFWINGGTSGGQQLQMYGNLGTGPTAQSARYYLSAPVANIWQQYTVPLSALGVANQTNFSGFAIQDSAGTTEPTFYLDDIELVSSVAPALTHLTVNASKPIRTADARWFSLNATIWDNNFDTPQTISLLTNMGIQALRFPGGSDSDDYHWLYNRQDDNDWTWTTSVASYIQVITNLNAQTMITLNYGTGSSNEAAAWVAYVNAATTNTQSLGVDTNGFNWETAGYWASLRAAAPLHTDDGKNFLRISRTVPLGFEYWEIGNEQYGASWETDSNNVPHDPYTYAERAKGYIALIKAVDVAVKIGVVVTPGVNSYVNNTSHPAVDPVTGQTNYGWTPVLLATLNSLGVTPDFAIYHNYPQNPGSENDAGLLGSSTGWASAAADLRGQITDYMGSKGANIELVCTENNSVSSAPGKQSVSLVNGLYKVDSLAQLMQTEFNGLFWWALRNGMEYDGNMSSALYGWREYGDYGVVDSGYTNLYPTYYTTELMTHFVRTGDAVITAASDYSLLSSYAVRRLDGSLTVLAINKDPVNTLTGQVAVTGFTPAASGSVYSYGIPQDNAAETGIGSPAVAQTNLSGVATNFNYAFPPYSATVLVLSPAPAKLLTTSIPPTASQFVFQLQGQVGVPYVIQRSTNLTAWTPVSTNTLIAGTTNITNSLAPSTPKQFWRAIWQP
jgi:alpha-L-arabinofuranosidase